MYFIVFAVVLAAVAVNGQTNICPGAKPMSNFDFSKYVDTWYIIAYSTCTVAMPNVKCQSRYFTKNDDGTANFKTSATDSKTNSAVSSDEILIGDKNEPAKLRRKDGSEIHILVDTDYENYTVVLSFVTLNGIPGSILMITSKKKEIMDDDVVAKYKQAMNKAGFDPDDLKQMDQTGCSED